jgi:hypothetical protein
MAHRRRKQDYGGVGSGDFRNLSKLARILRKSGTRRLSYAIACV